VFANIERHFHLLAFDQHPKSFHEEVAEFSVWVEVCEAGWRVDEYMHMQSIELAPLIVFTVMPEVLAGWTLLILEYVWFLHKVANPRIFTLGLLP